MRPKQEATPDDGNTKGTAAKHTQIKHKIPTDVVTEEKGKESQLPSEVNADDESKETKLKPSFNDGVSLTLRKEDSVDDRSDNGIISSEITHGLPKPKSIRVKTYEEEIKELISIKQLPRDHCLVTVWDFGGHYVFYSTHQTFLTRRAIYLIVLNISRPLRELVKELDSESEKRYGFKFFTEEEFYRFWLQSIICYGSTTEQTSPTIFVILTHIDKIPAADIDQKISEYTARVRSIAEEYGLRLPEENIIAVNSREPNDTIFDEIRQKIREEAQKQSHWGEYTPASYIMMEDYLLLQNTEENIVELEHIAPIARSILSAEEEKSQQDEAIVSFLKYQHELGNLIYFEKEELNKYIILNPKFLIDSFKCIFTFLSKDKMEMFEKNGQIDELQIRNIWRNGGLSEYTNYFLHLFIKLGIIVKRRQRKHETSYFFAPSKLKKKFDPREIGKMFTKSIVSPILCYKSPNKFISPATTSKLLTSCIEKWGDVEEDKEGELMIYCDGGVFRIKRNHLLVVVIDGVLLVCVLSRQLDVEICNEVRLFFQQQMQSINKGCSSGYKLSEYARCTSPLRFPLDDRDLVEMKQMISDRPAKCDNNHKLNVEKILQTWSVPDSRPSNILWVRGLNRLQQQIRVVNAFRTGLADRYIEDGTTKTET